MAVFYNPCLHSNAAASSQGMTVGRVRWQLGACVDEAALQVRGADSLTRTESSKALWLSRVVRPLLAALLGAVRGSGSGRRFTCISFLAAIAGHEHGQRRVRQRVRHRCAHAAAPAARGGRDGRLTPGVRSSVSSHGNMFAATHAEGAHSPKPVSNLSVAQRAWFFPSVRSCSAAPSRHYDAALSILTG